MRRLQRVFVGVDLHPREQRVRVGSAKAAEQAVWLARRAGAEIVLLHSTFLDDTADLPPGGLPTGEGQTTAEGWTALEALRAQCAEGGVSASVRLSPERPWIALTRLAMRGEADLVVVGKREGEESDGRRLGAVAAKLMRKCPGPVWLVQPEHDLQHKLVLAATDLTPLGEEVLEWSAWVVEGEDCALHVAHAYQLPRESLAASADEQAERLDALRGRAQSTILARLAGARLEREPVLHIGRNTPYHAIMESLEHLHPDLLVMGTISHGGVPGMLLGNTAERVLERVDCSLLTLKPAGFVSPVPPP
jgi:universal stress protein E